MSEIPHNNDEGSDATKHADGWTEHRGGEMPATSDRPIHVRYRNGAISETILARQRRWNAWPADVGDSDWDIVAWKFSDPTK